MKRDQQFANIRRIYGPEKEAPGVLAIEVELVAELSTGPTGRTVTPSERPVAVTQRSSARYSHWPFRCCLSPARRPAPRDICPDIGRARLGYDRARVLFKKHTATAASAGLELHQLRHSSATHLGDQKGPLQLIMAKTQHKSPRTAMRYVKPGDAAVAEVTSLLGLPRRSH